MQWIRSQMVETMSYHYLAKVLIFLFKTLDSVSQLFNSPFSESADAFKQMHKRSKMCINVSEALLYHLLQMLEVQWKSIHPVIFSTHFQCFIFTFQ